MIDIVGLLNYLGITHDRVLPFLILIGVIFYISYRFTSPIKKSVSAITRSILEIQTILKNAGIPLTHYLTEGPGSPLMPTEYGKQLIVDSGLETTLNEKKEFLKAELSKLLPEKFNEYDVQEKARALLLSLKDGEIMNPVKKYSYDNGIDIDIILKAGGLWLRDDFLEQKRQVKKDKSVGAKE